MSYRQLDHWARELHLVEPTIQCNGSGTQRSWSLHDVSLVRVLGRLSALGLDLHVCGDAIEALRDLPLAWWPDELRVELDVGVTLVVDTTVCVVE